MGEDKRKWIRFEDGLRGSKIVSDNELTNNNSDAYEQFRDQCVNQKPAEERRAILIFWGTNSGKGKAGKRKKNKKVDEDGNSTRELLIESIMKSCTLNRVDGRKFLTVSMIRCENADITNAAYLTEFERKVKKKEKVDSAQKVLDEGYRIVDSRKTCWGRRVMLSGQHIFNDAQDTAKKYRKIFTLIGNKILIQFAPIIITVLYFFINFLQKGEINKYGYMGTIFSIIYMAIWEFSKYTTITEIKYYKKLDLPVIFYNETGKTKRWMKSYIQSYMKGKGRKKLKRPVVYIGASDFNDADKRLNQFIIPEGYAEWGMICLCKLVRDLADDSWSEIKLRTDYANYNYCDDKRKDSFEGIADKSIDQGKNWVQKFELWDEEEHLAMMRTRLSEEYWSFCIVNRCKNKRMLYPIGKSVYVIYIFKSKAYYIDLRHEIETIMRTIEEVKEKYESCPQIRLWIIIVDEEEQRNLDAIGEIISELQDEDKVRTINKNMWKVAIQWIMETANKNDLKNLKKFIQLGEKEIRDENVKNIVDIMMKNNLYQEMTLKLDKE